MDQPPTPSADAVRLAIRTAGVRAIAGDLGASLSIVHFWAQTGCVPVKRWSDLNRALVARGHEAITEVVLCRAYEETA